MDDREDHAKHVLRDRAKKGYLSWQLWRELREQEGCAEFLAAPNDERTEIEHG